MNQLFRRIRYLLNRRRFDRELANEMEFHREMADGNGAFGNTLRLREEARDAWGWTWIDRLSQDLRYALRKLRQSPGFTLAAVLMLAIGIGVNVAAFSFFNFFVLKPLPVRDPGTLLRFERRSPRNYASDVPYPEIAFFREHSRTLSAVLALDPSRLTIDGEQKPLTVHFVTPNFFHELGASAMLGRTLDEHAAAGPEVVLSYGFWQRHFGADPLTVGRMIHLNNKPVTVIGIAYKDFSGLSMENPDLWAAVDQQPYFLEGSKLFTEFPENGGGVKMFARLQPGFTAQAAEAELRSLAAQLRKQQPAGIWENESLPSQPGAYAKNITGSRSGSGKVDGDELYPVVALVGALVLLILGVACGNLGSLLLARGVAREREIAIRVSVGAGRGRLIRQLFTESLLLALLGSAAGLGLGYVVFRILMVYSSTPAWMNPTPDWRVIVFAIAIGFGAAVLFGLTPALQLARQRHRATTLRQFLIGAQVAGSCVLLIVAGLLVRALDRAMTAHPGFEYQQVLSIAPGLAAHGYSPAAARGYISALENRLHGIPGVQSVSLATFVPLGRGVATMGVTINGHPIEVHINSVDSHFFETMSVPLLRGRDFRGVDAHEIVISDSMARQVWPGENPLGKIFNSGAGDFSVVGVAANARLVAMQDASAAQAYFSVAAEELPSMFMLVKTSGPPEGLVPFVASIAHSIDPKVFPQVELLKSSFKERVQGTQYSAVAVGALGFVALLLACFGIVGLVAFSVSQRTKEIGLRMALGAAPRDILSLVLRQLSRPVVAGLVVGVGLAAGLSQILSKQLYGISHLDPLAYFAAVGIFALAVAFAALLPARRALRVDPLLALRQD
jgi:predicted permease